MNDTAAKSFLLKLNLLMGTTIFYSVDNIIDEIYELKFARLVPYETGEMGITPMKLYITEKKMYEVLDQK